MGKWFDTNPSRVIDARLAYEGAGAMGRGLKGVGDAVSGYAKLKYKKQRDVKDDEFRADQKQNTNELAKLNIALGYDSNKSKVKVADINKESRAYQTDGSTNNNIRTNNTQVKTNKSREKVANITGVAKTTSASIGANAKLGSANIKLQGTRVTAKNSRANNITTNATQIQNTNTRAKATKTSSTDQSKRQKDNNNFKMKEQFEKQRASALDGITDKSEKLKIEQQYDFKIESLTKNVKKKKQTKTNPLNRSW